MKLYEIPRESKLLIEGVEVLFHKIDGMYSYCTLKDGAVVHLLAMSEWEKVGDYYEFVDTNSKGNLEPPGGEHFKEKE